PPVINCRKKFRALAKCKNFLSETHGSVLLPYVELKLLPPKRMNLRQFIFITGGGFFFACFLLIFQKIAG
ncbi:MAG TPA: hypothetical protein PKC58_13710, partial [Ignavibacteria bacterium]|nr:hypothetical protein [Ignavibacteria bacterium]